MPFIALLALLIFAILKIKSPGIKGAVGETKVNARLRFLGSEYVALHNILVRNSKGITSQIDQIVLSEYGIFVIETKHYKGWIFGNEKAENWMQVIFKERHAFRNPVKQNWSHVYALKDILADFPQATYFPIVVFTGNAELKEIESSVPVIYSSQLNATIRAVSTKKCLSTDDVLRIKALLESNAITKRGAKKAHVENIRTAASESHLKKENLICPKCNAALKLREGKYGMFYGCSNYPRCRFTMKQ